ncbi:MAG: hypothetical protein GY859_01740 [Desulfobacterales bacterium]|nr:hypothetical protein [Desulfobacterales bacterium]
MSRLTTGSDIMENAKREMVEKIRSSIDMDRLREVFLEQYAVEVGDDIDYKSGDIVIHDDQVAVELEYEVLLSLSVLIDSEGNPIIPEAEEEADEPDNPEARVEEAGQQAGEASQGWEGQ